MTEADNRVGHDHTLPQKPPEFLHLHQYRDILSKEITIRVNPGDYYVSSQEETIFTLLGSCVSVCIRDKYLGIGGMNHFLLPNNPDEQSDAWAGTPVSDQTRYGNVAMERLINTILRLGGSRNNLEVKLFGGARVLDINIDIGRKNLQFVRRYLMSESLSIVSEDVGGYRPRKILYYPKTGRVMLKRIYNENIDGIVGREERYLSQINHTKPSGEIDLF